MDFIRLVFRYFFFSSFSMATRNLTKKFDGYRAHRARVSDFSRLHDNDHNGPLLDSSEDSTRISVGLQHSLPPQWVDIVEQIQSDVKEIRQLMRRLNQLQTSRLKITFGNDDQKQSIEIENVTLEISRLFKDAETNLKRIATVGNAKGTNLPYQERAVRLSVMRGHAATLSDLSKEFRQMQKDFALRLKGQEEIGGDLFPSDNKSGEKITFTEMLDRDNLSVATMHQLNELEEQGSMREKEIVKLVQSINELAQIFRELNVLIVEQGTVLDRIDYNIEQAKTKVEAGNQELKKAEKSSRTARSLICILMLIILIVILVAILVYKKKNN